MGLQLILGQLNLQFREALPGLNVADRLRDLLGIELQDDHTVLVTISVPPGITPKVDAAARIQSGFFSADSKVLLDPGSDGAPFAASSAVDAYSNSNPTTSSPVPTAPPVVTRLVGVMAAPRNAVASAHEALAEARTMARLARPILTLRMNPPR